jgi:hypothetical protein
MAIHEGKWRCKGCERVNRGRDIECQGCGEARGEVEFFLDDDAPAVTEQPLLERAHAGADWICHYCSSSNAAGTEKCNGCGGPRDEGKRRQEGPVVHKHPHHYPGVPAAYAPKPSGTSALLPKLMGIFVALATLPLLFCCLSGSLISSHAISVPQRPLALADEPPPPVTFEAPPPAPPPPHHVAVTVSGVSWKRTVHTESLQTFEEKARTLPDGARNLSDEQVVDHTTSVKVGTRPVTKTRTVQTGTRPVTHSKQVQTGTRRVKTGTKSLGNGFFKDVYTDKPVYGTKTWTEHVPVYGEQPYTDYEPVYEQRPVYATVHRYEIDRWTADADTVLRGDDLDPHWPKVVADGTHRTTGRSERASVRLAGSGGETLHYELSSCDGLTRFAPGSHWDALVDYQGEVLSLDEPSAIATITSSTRSP